MKKLLTLLLFSIILLLFFGNLNAETNTQKKPKVSSSIISLAHTIFFQDSFHDEVSIYFAIITADRQGSEKVVEIVQNLYKEFANSGYKEIPINHPVPPRSTIFIEVIHRIDGIAVIIKKGDYERWKLFVNTDVKVIVEDIINKLGEREI